MQHKFMTRNSNIEVMSCIQLKMCDRIKTYNSKPKQVHVHIGARTHTHTNEEKILLNVHTFVHGI